jgi:UDP:flavonoid glycosyltransferase YjiC (YdhE family)
MRVLVVATPLPGHLLPLVPLARALRDAGHEVTVATAGAAVGVCPPDLSPVDVAPGLDLVRLMVGFAARHPLLARKEASGRGEPRTLGLLWGRVNDAMAEGLSGLTERVQPHLVLHEPFAAGAADLAARRGVPAVVVEHSLSDAGEQLAGLTAAPPAAVITTAPPSLVGARDGVPMRFVPPGAGATAPDDLAVPGPRPRLLVSRSTVEQPGRDRLMTTVVERAAGADVELVLVRPDRWVTRRPLPPGVRTADWLPFPAVLPAAAGIVHHGGAGTLLTALACGTPQLVFPGAGDRRTNAELLVRRGAGIAVELGDLRPGTLERLAGDPALRSAAREVAEEMAAMPAPRELVGVLEGLSRAAAPGAPAAPPPARARTR